MKQISRFVFLVVTGRFRNAFDLLRHLRLGTQFAFVGLGLGSYFVHQYPKELYSFGERGYYAAIVATTAKSDAIPLSRGGRQRLGELIETLQGDLTTEIMRHELGVEHGYNTWQVAQTVVALGGSSPVEAKAVQGFFEKNLDEECGCWRETPEKPPHTGATGWTVYSMSKLGIKAPPRILAFLLTIQSPDGWWPLLPARLEPKSASTYATAWATLALCSQLPLQQGAENSADAGKISFAIENSLNWLTKNEIAQSARWLDYPVNRPSFKSVSISGLIVHVMHQCGYVQGTARLHRQWLDSLASEITSADTTEISNTSINLRNGALDFDRTRHYVLQWQLVATVDAFAAGTLAQRATALQWIEWILTPGLVSPEVRNQNWVSAELLYALKYLQAHVASSGKGSVGT